MLDFAYDNMGLALDSCVSSGLKHMSGARPSYQADIITRKPIFGQHRTLTIAGLLVTTAAFWPHDRMKGNP